MGVFAIRRDDRLERRPFLGKPLVLLRVESGRQRREARIYLFEARLDRAETRIEATCIVHNAANVACRRRAPSAPLLRSCGLALSVGLFRLRLGALL